MKDFIFETKTKVYFGKNQMEHLGEEVSRFGKEYFLSMEEVQSKESVFMIKS